MCNHYFPMKCCERYMRTQRWRWQLSESWESAKMVFVLSFVISTWAIVATLAGPIAVPAPFPGGKIFCLLSLFFLLLKFWSHSPCCYLVSFANSFSLSSSNRKYLMKIILSKRVFYLARKQFWNNFCQHQFCAQMVPLKLSLKQQQMQNEEQIQTEWAQKHFATLRILNICKFGAKYWNIKLHLSNINNQCETLFQTFIQNMSQFLITINSIWILDVKIQKKYSMIAYKVFFLKFSQIELFEKIYFYKFSHLKKVLDFSAHSCQTWALCRFPPLIPLIALKQTSFKMPQLDKLSLWISQDCDNKNVFS